MQIAENTSKERVIRRPKKEEWSLGSCGGGVNENGGWCCVCVWKYVTACLGELMSVD